MGKENIFYSIAWRLICIEGVFVTAVGVDAEIDRIVSGEFGHEARAEHNGSFVDAPYSRTDINNTAEVVTGLTFVGASLVMRRKKIVEEQNSALLD
jgi:hypothetical protein